jgi:hypothetical protein
VQIVIFFQKFLEELPSPFFRAIHEHVDSKLLRNADN